MSHFKADSGSSLDACLDEIIASHARASSKSSRARPTYTLSPAPKQHHAPTPYPSQSFVCGQTMDWEPSEHPSTGVDSSACTAPVEDCSFNLGSSLPVENDNHPRMTNSTAPARPTQPFPKIQLEGFGGVPFSYQAEWLAQRGLPAKPMENDEWSCVVNTLRVSRRNKDKRTRCLPQTTSAEGKQTPSKRSNQRQRHPRPHDQTCRGRGNTSTSPKSAVVGRLGDHKVTKSSVRQD